jgi:uncharacterized membrane protein YraQ (UPF0718 family)
MILRDLQNSLKLTGAILLTAVGLILGLYYAPATVTAVLNSLLTTWLEMFVTHLPLLVLGSLTAGLWAVFVPAQTVQAFIPQRWPLQLIIAAVLGLIIPFGLFGNIPLARQFQRQGMRAGMVATFLLAAAMINPLTLVNSWITLGANLTMSRVIAAWSIAIGVGILFSLLEPLQSANRPISPADTLGQPNLSGNETRLRRVWAGLAVGADMFILFGALFVLSSLLTAVLTTFLPTEALLSTSVGTILLAFLSPPQTLFLSDTAVWLSRALPFTIATGYLTINAIFPLSAALLHTQLWRGRGWATILLISLGISTLIALL